MSWGQRAIRLDWGMFWVAWNNEDVFPQSKYLTINIIAWILGNYASKKRGNYQSNYKNINNNFFFVCRSL